VQVSFLFDLTGVVDGLKLEQMELKHIKPKTTDQETKKAFAGIYRQRIPTAFPIRSLAGFFYVWQGVPA